jgi:hypothetical protein
VASKKMDLVLEKTQALVDYLGLTFEKQPPQDEKWVVSKKK